jgi:hypothetical protein
MSRPPSPTAQQLLVQQNQALRAQDHALDNLSRVIGDVQGTAVTIGETATLHTRLLDEIHDDVEIGTRSIETETERLALVKSRSETHNLWCVIMILFGVLLIMVFMKV